MPDEREMQARITISRTDSRTNMHGRTSLALLTFALSLGFTGCITTQSQKTSTTAVASEDVPRTVKNDGVKRTPQAKTEIAFGKLKEGEADSEAGNTDPEGQARLRDEARRAYQQALKIEPNNLEAHRALAGIYVKKGDFDRALDTYKKAMVKHPKDANLWYDLGLCHHRRKDFPESIKCFTKALEMEPENPDYMKKLGFTLAWTGQIEQGLTLLARAQGRAMAHYNIARVLLQKDQQEQARQHLTAALRENSQLAEARELLTSLENPAVKN